MKLKSTLVFGALAIAASQFASAQTVVNITGATAFREAAHSAIISLLGGDGVAQRARADINLNGATSASNLRIYRGFVGGQEYIVRATFSGSTQGILDLADQNQIPFLNTNTTMTTTGNGALTGATQASNTSNAAPHLSFSDVEKTLSERPTASLGGGPVGVVPFMFVMGKGIAAGNRALYSNMTDQIHEALWSTGQIDASLLTNVQPVSPNTSTTTILATGRNNGSGTRATILSETGYGSFRNIVQFDANTTSGEIAQFATNGGHSSNSGVSGVLGIDRSILKFGGTPVDAVFCGYLTISDAVTATGYVEATGASNSALAIPMTYNGVRYSVENVRNGSYTLWGYQQLYTAASIPAGVTTFDTALRAAIPGSLTAATGIAIPTMKVTRFGGDGGIVQPNPVE